MNFDTENITVTPCTLEQIGRLDISVVRIKIKGYWSNEAISVYVQRYTEAKWVASINHSSGGRDTKEVVCDAEAARYFAEGMLAAAKILEFVEDNSQRIEIFYVSWLKEMNEIEEKNKQEAQRKIDADPALGSEKALELLKQITDNDFLTIKVYTRGKADEMTDIITARKIGKTAYYVTGDFTSKKRVLEMLTSSSIRTHVTAMSKYQLA